MAPKTKTTIQKVENSTPQQNSNIESQSQTVTQLSVVESQLPVVESQSPVQKGGKKNKKVKDVKTEEVKTEEVKDVKTEEVKKGKKKGVKAVTEEKEGDGEVKEKKGKNKKLANVDKPQPLEDFEEDDDLKTRSFKVKLPGNNEFIGRFTGLTPYQAANKALSKYFRGLETEDNSQVNFSIRESTRGSKRHEYIYKGSRLKLDIPITYTIKSVLGDERIITKQYKNQLVKVKKGVPKEKFVSL